MAAQRIAAAGADPCCLPLYPWPKCCAGAAFLRSSTAGAARFGARSRRRGQSGAALRPGCRTAEPAAAPVAADHAEHAAARGHDRAVRRAAQRGRARAGRAVTDGEIRQGHPPDHQRPGLARVCRSSRRERHLQADPRGPQCHAEHRAAARQLRRACRLWPGQRGAHRQPEGRDRPRVLRAARRRARPARESLLLPAGGLRIEGRVGTSRIPQNQISFAIYKGSQFESGERASLVPNVAAGDVVLLPEGTYYIISNYGDANSVVRSDIRVQAGKLTDVTITHRAAVITLKLVSDKGGEALANTAWSVLTPGGDVIKESIGAFPRVVLSEGEYRAIAKNEGKVFERGFNVVNGVDGEVEVVAR